MAAGIGMKYELDPPAVDDLIGDPIVVEAEVALGSSNGELRIGFSITDLCHDRLSPPPAFLPHDGRRL